MDGGPIEQAKNALRACVRSLGSEDTFSILAFADRLEWFAAAPAKVDQASMNAAEVQPCAARVSAKQPAAKFTVSVALPVLVIVCA